MIFHDIVKPAAQLGEGNESSPPQLAGRCAITPDTTGPSSSVSPQCRRGGRKQPNIYAPVAIRNPHNPSFRLSVLSRLPNCNPGRPGLRVGITLRDGPHWVSNRKPTASASELGCHDTSSGWEGGGWARSGYRRHHHV